MGRSAHSKPGEAPLLFMQLLEKELEDMIFRSLTEENGGKLNNSGLVLPSVLSPNRARWFRQLSIEPYGRIDIVGFYREFGEVHIDLLELKVVPIQEEHFEQIFQYKKGLEHYLENTFKSVTVDIRSFLIGPEYKSGHYIQNNSNIGVAIYEYDLDGVTFETHFDSKWHKPDGNSKSFRKPKHNGQKVY